MAAATFILTLVFVGLGLAAAFLVAVHDAIEGWLERRSFRHLRGGGEGGVPLPLPAPPRPRRQRPPASLPALAKGVVLAEASERPAWFENARRDLAHR